MQFAVLLPQERHQTMVSADNISSIVSSKSKAISEGNTELVQFRLDQAENVLALHITKTRHTHGCSKVSETCESNVLQQIRLHGDAAQFF